MTQSFSSPHGTLGSGGQRPNGGYQVDGSIEYRGGSGGSGGEEGEEEREYIFAPAASVPISSLVRTRSVVLGEQSTMGEDKLVDGTQAWSTTH
jgi:hypothetical protein